MEPDLENRQNRRFYQIILQEITPLINVLRDGISRQPVLKLLLIFAIIKVIAFMDNYYVFLATSTIALIVLMGLEHGFEWVFKKLPFLFIIVITFLVISITIDCILHYLAQTYLIIVNVKEKDD
ncbi:uncharacterized protein LOC103570311 [Microplitis demolitor]|uniref:uncharacterized protein LOC103570311 n=1 Tax=Microplitis demolitor TaxID=69319 RepID=UPI00044000CC|nr:uncharacterized protein LOC103570311 [Microplitis demolitor]